MISRLLKILGLFCKRALQKRRYSAKETYDFKEPTNRSQPIRHRWLRHSLFMWHMSLYVSIIVEWDTHGWSGKGLQHLLGATKCVFSFFYIFWNSDYRQRFPRQSTDIWRDRKHRFCVLKFPLSPLHSTRGYIIGWLWSVGSIKYRSLLQKSPRKETIFCVLKFPLSPLHSTRGVTHCNTLQHTATHCNTLQHTATHCNTLQHIATLSSKT